MGIQQDIKNIVFDLGGVLCGLDADRCIKAFFEIGAEEVAVYVQKHRVEDLFLRAELGQISTHEFCDEVRHITNRDLTDDRIVWAWNELLTGITEERKAAVTALSKRYRLFVLSNTNDMHWTRWEEMSGMADRASVVAGKLSAAEPVFEKTFLSYRLHLAKPSHEIYETVLLQAGLQAEQTLFIDDSLTNCKAAEEVGIRTFHNKSINDWLTLL